MSIKIQEFAHLKSLSIKIQDFPEQSLEFKQDPRMGGNLEFEQDSRLYLYLKEYQFKQFIYSENNQNLSHNLSPFPPQKPFLHYHYIQTSQIDFSIAPQEHLNHPDSL